MGAIGLGNEYQLFSFWISSENSPVYFYQFFQMGCVSHSIEKKEKIMYLFGGRHPDNHLIKGILKIPGYHTLYLICYPLYHCPDIKPQDEVMPRFLPVLPLSPDDSKDTPGMMGFVISIMINVTCCIGTD